MKYIYNVKEDETFAASDMVWAQLHSLRTVIKPKYNHNFEGKPIKTPDASTFWRIISEHKVGTMFTAPTTL
jgi:propionyl-CoA synthetase